MPKNALHPAAYAAAGWLFPGLGHLLSGHTARGFVLMSAIMVLFLSGLLIGGVSVIQPPGSSSEAWWFFAQALMGPIAFLSAWLNSWAQQAYEGVRSTALVFEAGTLYTAIAGVLNLLAIVDAASRTPRVTRSVPARKPGTAK